MDAAAGRDPIDAVVLLGIPASGKGTVARRLAADHGLVHVEVGRALRARAERSDAIGDRIALAQARGVMVATDVVLAVLGETLADLPSDRAIVLDGFPRTVDQVAAIDDGRVRICVRLAVWFDVAPEVADERRRRRRQEEGRVDDDDVVARTRFDLAAETLGAVRDVYAARGMLEIVDASQSADEVFERVVACTAGRWSLV